MSDSKPPDARAYLTSGSSRSFEGTLGGGRVRRTTSIIILYQANLKVFCVELTGHLWYDL